MKKDIIEITFKDFFKDFESEIESLVWFKYKKRNSKILNPELREQDLFQTVR